MKLTESLGQFEQLVLTAVMALDPEEAYGMPIYSKVCELADREANLGSVYVTLERLQKKGYVAAKVSKATPDQGGKPRRFYRVLPAGMAALRENAETSRRVSETFFERIRKWNPVKR